MMEQQEREQLYTRQAELPVRDGSDMRVAVIGCGGVGAWVGLLIGLAGAERMELFDGDRLETSNLNRMPYGPDAVGKAKSEALEGLIHALRPSAEVTARPHFNGILHAELLSGMSHVVVSTDNLKSRSEVAKLAAKYAVRYIECGAEGLQASATSSPPEWSTDKEEVAGYEVVPSFVGPCVTAAALAVTQLFCEDTRHGFTYQASWNHERDMVKLFARKEED